LGCAGLIAEELELEEDALALTEDAVGEFWEHSEACSEVSVLVVEDGPIVAQDMEDPQVCMVVEEFVAEQSIEDDTNVRVPPRATV
jgi:hypothetical protein